MSARAFGSQGQQKTAAIALRLGEIAVIQSRRREYPVVMLDDVFSELDAGRAGRLLESLTPGVQCLLTTTTSESVLSADSAGAARLYIRNGALES